MEVPDTAWGDFFYNQTSGSTLKNMAYGRQFLGSRTPKLTFVESKRCQFLFILSMGQDGVFKKTLTSPILNTNIFLGTPCILSVILH